MQLITEQYILLAICFPQGKDDSTIHIFLVSQKGMPDVLEHETVWLLKTLNSNFSKCLSTKCCAELVTTPHHKLI